MTPGRPGRPRRVTAPRDDQLLPLLRVGLPGWHASAKRIQDASNRVDELRTEELRAAEREMYAAIEAGNDVSLAYDGLIRALSEERREKVYAALREAGFPGLAREIEASL